jgi:multidrug resistance efflux pump
MFEKVGFLIIAGLIFLGTGAAFSQAQEASPVKTNSATKEPVQEISLTADIDPFKKVQVVPEVNGTLQEISVDLGDIVEKGKVIARIDSESIALQVQQAEAALKIAQANLSKAKKGAREEEIEQAQAAYQQALASFHNAQEELQRAEDDYSRGAIPEQSLDTAKLNTEVAKAQLAQAKASFELTKKGSREEDIQIAEADVKNAEASLKLAKSNLEDCTIEAPISGTVEERFADEGSVVGPGQPLLSMVDISLVKVVLHVGEEILDKVPLTQKIAVTVENYLDQVFIPQKINIAPTMDPESRKIEAKVIIPNPDLRLKPGMFARVKLILTEEK